MISFLTRNMSLMAWKRGGMLDRELALFCALVDLGWEVHLVSHGGREDRELAPRGVRVHTNSLRLPLRLYERQITRRLRRIRRPAVVRSNQVRGAESAARVAERLRLPFVARCGYLPSLFSEWADGVDSPAARTDRALERRVFGGAERVIVSTPALAEHVRQTCDVKATAVEVVPNFVEVDRFEPRPERARSGEIIFVGRLEPQKDVSLLIRALETTPYRLVVVGDGPLREPLSREAAALGVPASFEGNVPHADLPARLQEATAFCLPSRYEGHPKALLEAMACGLPVIATDSPGIRDVLQDGTTGLLCPPDPTRLRDAIRSVMEDATRRKTLGNAARRFILDHCTLAHVVEREIEVASSACGAQEG